MAGLVDDRARGEGAARIAVELPLPGIVRQPLAVEPIGRIGEPGVVAPPEGRPFAVGAGPEDAEVVDRAVAVVVVLREVVPLGLVIVQGLLDQVHSSGARLRDGAPEVRGLVPAEDVAGDRELVVRGAQIEVAEAVVGRTADAVAEEPAGEIRRRRHPGIIAERDEQGQDLDRALGRHPLPGRRRREAVRSRGLHRARIAAEEGQVVELGPEPVLDALRDLVIAEGAGLGDAVGERAVQAVAQDLFPRRGLQGRGGDQPGGKDEKAGGRGQDGPVGRFHWSTLSIRQSLNGPRN